MPPPSVEGLPKAVTDAGDEAPAPPRDFTWASSSLMRAARQDGEEQ